MADKRRRADDDEDDDDVGLRTPSKKPAKSDTKSRPRPEPAEEKPKAKGDTGRRPRDEKVDKPKAEKSDDAWRKVEKTDASLPPVKDKAKKETGKRPAVAAPAAGGGAGKKLAIAAGVGLVLAAGGMLALFGGAPDAPTIATGARPGQQPLPQPQGPVVDKTPTAPLAPPPGYTPPPQPQGGPATEAAQPQTATLAPPAPPQDLLRELAARSADHAAVARILEEYNAVFRVDPLSADPLMEDFQRREALEKELIARIQALGAAAVPALLEMLTGLDQRAQQIFLSKALAGMDCPEAMAAVQKALDQVKDVSIQTTLVRFLPENERGAEVVARSFGAEPNPTLRGMLLREYSRRVDERSDAGRELFRRSALEDPDPNVRAEAVTLIGRRGDARDQELMEQICQNEQNLPIRQRAIVSYAETGRERALPYLERLARDPNQSLPVRASAVLAIGRVGSQDAIRSLDLLAQTDPDQEIRTRANRLAQSLRAKAQAQAETPVNEDPVRVMPGAPGVGSVDKN